MLKNAQNGGNYEYAAKSQRTNIHARKIVRNLLIFSILCNIIYLPCYFYIRKNTRAKVTEHYQYQLERGMQMFDSSINSFLALGLFISQSTDFNEIHYVSPVSTQTLDDLQSLTALYLTIPYPFIANFGLTEGDQILFTKNEIYFNRDLLTYDHYFSCDDSHYLDRFQDTYCLLPAKNFSSTAAEQYSAVTIGYCCSAVNGRYLFAHYPVESLLSLFADKNALSANYVALYNKDTIDTIF